MKRAGLYVRVSTQEQKLHGMSVDAQIEALRAFCKANNYSVYKIYNDAGISARKSYKKRPALLDMLRDCEQKKIDIVLFTRLDRFFRSVPDYYACVEKMNNVPWKAISEDYETTTPDGVFKVNIMLSVAQSEADKTSARVKDSYTYRIAKGDYIGLPPIGYKVEQKRLVKDPETENGVNALFKTYLSTYSTSKAINAAFLHGLRFDRSNVQKVLQNPTYTGTTVHGHKCEPYITPKEHDMICQVKRSRAVKKKYFDRVYIFSGVLICGYCGRRMTGKTRIRKKNGHTYTWVRYACGSNEGTKNIHPHIEIAEQKMENYLMNNLSSILNNLSFEGRIDDTGTIDRHKEMKRLNGKLERLREVYIDGDMDKDEYKKRKTKIEQELASIPSEHRPLPNLPDTWTDVYSELSKENKQVFWKSTVKQIIITNENKDHPPIIFY